MTRLLLLRFYFEKNDFRVPREPTVYRLLVLYEVLVCDLPTADKSC